MCKNKANGKSNVLQNLFWLKKNSLTFLECALKLPFLQLFSYAVLGQAWCNIKS